MKKQRWFPLFFLLLILLMGFTDDKAFRPSKNDVKGTLLVYTGNISGGPMNQDIGIHIEISPTEGVRCDVVVENGEQVLGHSATIFRVDDRKKYVGYNYLTGKTHYYAYKPPENNTGKFSVTGKATLGSYSCTQLELPHGAAKSIVWMSTQVPGYQQLKDINFQIAPGNNVMMTLIVSIPYGAMVKFTSHYSSPNGAQGNAEINLTEANPDMSFPEKDFEFPKK